METLPKIGPLKELDYRLGSLYVTALIHTIALDKPDSKAGRVADIIIAKTQRGKKLKAEFTLQVEWLKQTLESKGLKSQEAELKALKRILGDYPITR